MDHMVDMDEGQFFLGGGVADGERTGDDLIYDADHLTTHGVIVGMTGSGKTGLGIDVLEEALLSGIPTLIIGNWSGPLPRRWGRDCSPRCWLSPWHFSLYSHLKVRRGDYSNPWQPQRHLRWPRQH